VPCLDLPGSLTWCYARGGVVTAVVGECTKSAREYNA
jgi:hypothetical protein